jgi:hypothetical protein
VNDITGLDRRLLDVPAPLLEAFGEFWEKLPVLNTRGPHFCREDAARQQLNVVLSGAAEGTAAEAEAAAQRRQSEGVLGLDHFDIKPTRIEDAAFAYLYRFRKGGHFTKTRGYH